MAIVNDPRQPAGNAFVVVNDQGRHALWQAELDVPPGWRRQSSAMSRQDWLNVIDDAWQDIAPASVREAAPGA